MAAAAAGTAAAADPPPAPAPPDPRQRRFRLIAGEAIPDGIRRIAAGQLADGADELAAATEPGLGPAVHDARKRIKRVRAVLRLSRDAIDEGLYVRENMQLRNTAARLSTARDARVLIETLAALEARFAADLPPDATVELRARLHDEHERALEALAAEGVTRETSHALAQAGARTAEWTFERDDFAALEPSLRRIYRRGRKRLNAARAEPSAENLHDCRKRVKDLWHVSQVLRPVHPKRMKRLSRRAHKLADLLGDHHDLSVLRDYVEVHPHHFEDGPTRDALLAAIDRRRGELSRRAVKLGRGVYKRPPKRFIADIERGWRKRLQMS
ncbi:MAG: CHAD domain-containing protein [Actinobacteria bacterium]|nr:CHAD domain-containing protein [Actinomycetota bacterium]